MRNRCLVLLFSCLLAANASSQQQSSPSPSQSADPAKNSLPDPSKQSEKTPVAGAAAKLAGSKAPDYAQESFVIEQMHSHYRFEADGTGRKETTARIRVQSEAGVQQWGQIQEGYNSANERVEIPYVRVLKEDGTVVKADDDAVQDLSAPVEHEAPVYTDYRQKHITVPGLRPGEVLEYDMVTVIHTPLAAGQFWADYEFDKSNITLDETLDVDVPAGRTLKLKCKPGMDPKITEENGRRIYHWSGSHLEREDDPAKEKDKKKKKHRPDDERPDIQLTTFETWEQIGRWYASLEKDRRAPSPEVRAKAQELTKGLNTDIEKIEALYDFVAKNFRYVSLSLGVGRYQPHAASDVLHDQYGDCKDKHTLLASLLDAEGLHAWSVLINSSRKLDPDVPSPSQFDHVITMLPLGKEEVWMDTTAEVAPFRLLSYTLRKKQALVIPPADPPSSVAPHLLETPADTPMPDTEVLPDHRQDQRHRQTRSARALRISRRRRTHAAFHLPPRAAGQLATCRRKRKRRTRRRYHQSQNQRSRRHPRAVHHVVRRLQTELPRLVEEENRNRSAAGAIQPARRRRRRCRRRRRTREARPESRLLLQDHTRAARQVHGPRSAGLFVETRLRGIRSHLQS